MEYKFEEWVGKEDLEEFRKEVSEFNKELKPEYHWGNWFDYGEGPEQRYWCCLECGFGISAIDNDKNDPNIVFLKCPNPLCKNHK